MKIFKFRKLKKNVMATFIVCGSNCKVDSQDCKWSQIMKGCEFKKGK